MQAVEIVVIVISCLIVAGVAAFAIIRKRKGKTCCGCDCKTCGGCKKDNN